MSFSHVKLYSACFCPLTQSTETVCPDPCVRFVIGAPSPEGYLGTAGVRGEEGQHGDPRARSREQHLLLRLAVPRRLQDAKAAHSLAA